MGSVIMAMLPMAMAVGAESEPIQDFCSHGETCKIASNPSRGIGLPSNKACFCQSALSSLNQRRGSGARGHMPP
jgi:hypothetical protein